MLNPVRSVSFYRNREAELRKYFHSGGQLVYCTDVEGLLLFMRLPAYDSRDCRLFIDSSKRSLKCVLLHNGNKYAYVQIGHSVNLKEEYIYITISRLFLRGCNIMCGWLICVNFKIVNFILG